MRYAFLDIETSGLDPIKHEPIEVAYLIYENEEHSYTRNLSLPFNIHEGEPKALEVNGFGKREFPPMWDLRFFAGTLQTDLENTWIIGNNVQFDMGFLVEVLRKFHRVPTWKYHLIDVKAVAAGKLNMKPPWSTDKMCAKLGIDVPGVRAHTALGDAEWNRDVWEAIYGTI